MSEDPNVGPPPPFFLDMMRIRPAKPRSKFTTAKKGGGKSAKAKKIRSEAAESLDIFKVYSIGNSLADDPGTRQQWCDHHLKGLTRDQLKQLRKKIRAVRRLVFDKEESDPRLIEEIVEEFYHVHRKVSDSKLKNLRRRVKNRLKKLIKSKQMPEPQDFDAFITEHMEDLAGEYEVQVNLGQILSEERFANGYDFIKDVLRKS